MLYNKTKCTQTLNVTWASIIANFLHWWKLFLKFTEVCNKNICLEKVWTLTFPYAPAQEDRCPSDKINFYCRYEGCPESIRPFWISREPVAWPWCNLAANHRRPYCASVNSHSPVGASQPAVRRRWLSLRTVWPSQTQISSILTAILTLRWLMSYIYGAPILDVSRSHTTMQHSR